MTEGFAQYLYRVPSDEDRVLLEEAVGCADAGALRAAYILVWISAAEALKRRFRQLAPQDHVAGKIIGDVEQKESSHQAVDIFLLQKAKEYGFISESEFIRLEHVYTMRCLYGHPYEESPSPESLRAALLDVIDIVLSRPAKLRHAFINSQVDLLCERRSFLDDSEAAVARYATEIQPKIADELHTYLVGKLLERLSAIEADASMSLFFQRGVWFLQAYLLVDAPLLLGQWDTVPDLAKYPKPTALVLAQEQFWPHLSDHAREMAIGELLEAGQTAGDCLRALQALHKAGVMSGREADRFTTAVANMALEYLASTGLSPCYFVEQLITELKSHTWPRQNPAIQVLRNVGPGAVEALPSNKQRELGNNVLQVADGNAHAAIGLLETIGSDPRTWPQDFVAGIAEECFVNDEGKVRFKCDQLPLALGCLRSLSRTSSNAVVQAVAKRISVGDFKHAWDASASERQKVLNALRQATEMIGQCDLEPIVDAIQALDMEDDDA